MSVSVSLRRNITMSAATTAAHSGRTGGRQGSQARDSFNRDLLEVSRISWYSTGTSRLGGFEKFWRKLGKILKYSLENKIITF